MTKCQICGNPFDDCTLTKPKLYCSPECRNYNKYKNALEKIIIGLQLTKEAKRIIKGDMFRLSNLVRIGTNMTPDRNDD